MIKFTATTPQGRTILGFGLSYKNLRRLKQGQPIKVNVEEMGQALDAIHEHFAPLYQVEGRFYAMDVEFKFDDLDTGEAPSLWVKQARPHYGWGDSAQ